MNEPDVVAAMRTFFSAASFPDGAQVTHLRTDAHLALIDYGGLGPYQRISIPIGRSVVHPDLVGQLSDGETLVALEAKGAGDLVKGIAQAEQYQQGVQQSFLALPSDRLNDLVRETTRRKNIGLLVTNNDAAPHLLRRAQVTKDRVLLIRSIL